MAIPVEPLAGPTPDEVPAPVKLVPAVLAIPFAPVAELVAPAVPAVTAAVSMEPVVLTEPVVEPEAALVTPVEPDVGLVVPVVAVGDEPDGLGEEVVCVTLSLGPAAVEDDPVDAFTAPVELPVVG